MSRLTRRLTAVLLIVVQAFATAGCHSWSTQTGSAESVLAAKPEQVRISTRSEPAMTEIVAPRVANDTLFGSVKGTGARMVVPLDQITSMQLMKVSAGKTIGLAVGATAGALVVVGGILIANCEPSGLGGVC